MIKLSFLTATALLCASIYAAPASLPRGGSSTPSGFTDDFAGAKAEAARSCRLVFTVFTGSDWCPYCKKLDAEILSKSEFVSAMKDDFVLVFIDRPRNQNLLSSRAKKANPDILAQYEIRGFPTVYVLNPQGRIVARVGGSCAPADYAARIKEQTRAELDRLAPGREALALPYGNPTRLSGFDKILSPLPFIDRRPYSSWINELLAVDKTGSLGYKAKYEAFKTLEPMWRDSDRLDAEFRMEKKRVGDRAGNNASGTMAKTLEEQFAVIARSRDAAIAKTVFPKYTVRYRELADRCKAAIEKKDIGDVTKKEVMLLVADLEKRAEALESKSSAST